MNSTIDESRRKLVEDFNAVIADTEALLKALAASGAEKGDALRDAAGRTIVTFCLCPNEASAALVAERLMRAGHHGVRVLSGGEEALAMLARPAGA